jgi:flavin reductase (DIM6/NTAB) family NADH-FMN oxidoreductase RutF
MPVTQAEFRTALRHLAAGVTVVTTRDAEGRPSGLTASAFTAVSLEPPLVLVCVDHAATAHPALSQHGWFAINVLSTDQEAVARQFAASGGDKFAGVAFREGLARLPILEGVLVALECRVVSGHEAGDHTIFVGQLERASVSGGVPLVYFQGTYHHVIPNGDPA